MSLQPKAIIVFLMQYLPTLQSLLLLVGLLRRGTVP